MDWKNTYKKLPRIRRSRSLSSFDWRDLKKIKKADIETSLRRALQSPYLYLSLGIIIGALFMIQLKTESRRPLNPILFYDEFRNLREDALENKDELRNKIKTLQSELDEKEKTLGGRDSSMQKLIDGLSEQELILGTTKVSGSGVVITISDGSAQIKDEFAKSLTHAADLRDIVNLLWYAGAEAISINGERIVHNTSINCIVSTIMINTTDYVPPFTIEAIGNRYDLYNLLSNSRKLVDIKKRASKNQINFGMNMQNNIEIDPYTGVRS